MTALDLFLRFLAIAGGVFAIGLGLLALVFLWFAVIGWANGSKVKSDQ